MTVKERLDKIEERLSKINLELGQLIGAEKSTATLIKWVILPLIVILGGLIGIKIF